MQTKQIIIGETYQVGVPRHMPPERYLDYEIQWFAQMSLMKGARLRLSVLSVDPATGMVEGVQVAPAPVVAEVRLPEASVRELGLAERDGGYWVRGPVVDHEKKTVLVPEAVTYTVLSRWVRPCTDPAAAETRPGTVHVS